MVAARSTRMNVAVAAPSREIATRSGPQMFIF